MRDAGEWTLSYIGQPGRRRLVEIHVSKDGTKLDLYDTDSKPVRKDQTDVPAYADGN